MLRKLLAPVALLTLTSSLAFADSSGPYVGAGLGVIVNTSGISSFRGGEASLMAGYGGVFAQSIYAAIEVFGDGKLGSFNDNSTSGNSVQIKYDYGASILPGFVMTPSTLMFARLGAIRAHFNAQSITVTGYQAGAGFQINIAPCMDIRPEYIYTTYRQVSSAVGKPKSDQVKLSIIYRFS